MRFEGLVIPLEQTTTLGLPLTVASTDSAVVTLKTLDADVIEQAFRHKFEELDENRYQIIRTDPYDYFADDNMPYFLHNAHLQLFVTTNGDSFNDDDLIRRISFALHCVLGSADEYVSWMHSGEGSISTISSRGEYRSFNSSSVVGVIGQEQIEDMKTIIEYTPNDDLSDEKFNTIRALYSAAIHQAKSRDVSCVLYISILEAIYVQDDSELSYKLSMRIAKMFSKDATYAKHIKDLYTKRGHVIHGSQKGEVFSHDQHRELEELTRLSVLMLIRDPHRFTRQALDDLLLV